jgi:hypothetical protein
VGCALPQPTTAPQKNLKAQPFTPATTVMPAKAGIHAFRETTQNLKKTQSPQPLKKPTKNQAT